MISISTIKCTSLCTYYIYMYNSQGHNTSIEVSGKEANTEIISSLWYYKQIIDGLIRSLYSNHDSYFFDFLHHQNRHKSQSIGLLAYNTVYINDIKSVGVIDCEWNLGVDLPARIVWYRREIDFYISPTQNYTFYYWSVKLQVLVLINETFLSYPTDLSIWRVDIFDLETLFNK